MMEDIHLVNNEVDFENKRKRHMLSDEDVEIKRERTCCFVKILIAGEWAGIVLGKGGETIVSLQKETDCTITLSKSDAFFPGTRNRICIINSSTDTSVRDAFHKMMNRINLIAKVDTIKFIVPDSLTELLTVKEDNCIKRIQDAGVVSVKLSDKVDTLSERIITVTGNLESMSSACDEIMSTIFSDPSLNLYTGNSRHLDQFNYTSDIKSQKSGVAGPWIKLLIPNGSVGFVMGKRGETIASIKKSTDCRIVLSKEDKYYPGTMDRICVITGLCEENICSALILILNHRFKTHDVYSNVEVKLLIPNDVAGSVIGKDGATIKNLENVYGVTIRLSKKSDTLSERTVAISAKTLEPIHSVCRKIIPTISSTNYSEHARIDYDDVLSTAFIDYPDPFKNRVPDHLERKRGCNTSPILTLPLKFHLNGDGNPCTLPFELYLDIMRTFKSEGHTGGEAAVDIYKALSTLAKYGIITLNECVPSYLSSSSFSSTVTNSIVEDTRLLLSTDKTTKTDIQIPNINVGAIMGTSGKTLLEIQQQTKTKIKISGKGDYAPGTMNRVVSIYGTESDIDKAKRLIYRSITDAELKRMRKY